MKVPKWLVSLKTNETELQSILKIVILTMFYITMTSNKNYGEHMTFGVGLLWFEGAIQLSVWSGLPEYK